MYGEITGGSLCAGAGGLDLGLEASGIKMAWHAESDQACSRVLARHWDIPNLGDLRTIDWEGVPGVDVISAGFPCQPVSTAGNRLGEADERWLWPEVLRAIRSLRPRFVILENVPGLATRGLGGIVGDLAQELYVGSSVRLRASDIGAPHRRERLFVIAAADAGSERFDRRGGADAQGTPGDGEDRWASAEGYRAPASDSDSGGRTRVGVSESSGVEGERGNVADGRNSEKGEWGAYAPAIERWTGILGRESPRPTDDRGRLNPGFVEWMLGFPPGWTEEENRTQRLRMLGNAVQVQCGEVIGRMLREERF